jgi:hypothetical protein
MRRGVSKAVKRLIEHTEVEKELRKLEQISFPECDLPEDEAFLWNVRQKIAGPSLFLVPHFSPAVALSAAAIVLIVGLWVYQTQVFGPEITKAIQKEIPLSGAILTARGDLGGQGQGNVHEGDHIRTGPDSSMTFYFPAAGYVHIGSNSSVTVEKAKEEWPAGKVIYRLNLEEGAVYSRLEDLEGGSTFHTRTPYGTTRVLGTEFLVTTSAQIGMSVQVLKGLVKVGSLGNDTTFSNVKKGFRALLSPNQEGTILTSEILSEELEDLGAEFNAIFLGAVHQSQNNKSANEPNFRILLRREG